MEKTNDDEASVPICLLSHPLDLHELMLYPCCSKIVCNGCAFGHTMAEKKDIISNNHVRSVVVRPNGDRDYTVWGWPGSEKDMAVNNMKRVEANDLKAIFQEGQQCYHNGVFDKGS